MGLSYRHFLLLTLWPDHQIRTVRFQPIISDSQSMAGNAIQPQLQTWCWWMLNSDSEWVVIVQRWVYHTAKCPLIKTKDNKIMFNLRLSSSSRIIGQVFCGGCWLSAGCTRIRWKLFQPQNPHILNSYYPYSFSMITL